MKLESYSGIWLDCVINPFFCWNRNEIRVKEINRSWNQEALFTYNLNLKSICMYYSDHLVLAVVHLQPSFMKFLYWKCLMIIVPDVCFSSANPAALIKGTSRGQNGQLLSHVHSQKELAHWTVNVTVQNYACCFSGWLRCNNITHFYRKNRSGGSAMLLHP